MPKLFTLTGFSTSAVLAVLALTVAVGTVLAWPLLARPGLRWIAARIGLLISSNVTVLLMVAVTLNNQFLFFASWTDLFGIFGSDAPAKVTESGAPPARTPVPPMAPAVDGRQLPPLPPGSGPDGRQVWVTVTGARSGLTGTVLLRLPAGYRRSTASHPVLMTFSGYPGSPAQWLGPMQLPRELDLRIAGGQLRDPIVVAPTVEFPAGADTECVDAGRGRNVETWISQDVPDWIRTHLRVLDDRRAWATIGLSSGGWCAAMTTMLHPDRFSAAVVFGGYFRPKFAGPSPLTYNRRWAARYNLVRQARHRPPGVSIWLLTSRTDRVSYPTTALFLAAARAPLRVRALVLADAGHRLSVYRPHLPAALDWLGRTAAGFAPLR